MSLTAEEVRVKLGLRPWEEQKAAHPERPGKTLAMICRMIADASDGKALYLVAHTVSYARHVASLLRRLARECGVTVDVTIISRDRDRENMLFASPGTVRGVEKGTYTYHWDHSVWDAR